MVPPSMSAILDRMHAAVACESGRGFRVRVGGLALGRRVRRVGWRFAIVLGLGLAGLCPSTGAEEPVASDETRAWEVVARLFEGAVYDLAEQEIQAFTAQYPQSDKLPEAQLLLAEVRCRQGKYALALEGLEAHAAQAGPWADQYRFWTGESLSRLLRFDEAVEVYAGLVRDYPESSRLLDAVVGQAFALQQSGKVNEAFALLSRPDGLFLKLSTGRESEEVVALGFLLMGETALASGQAAAGVALLERLPGEGLAGPLAWQRVHLLARLQARLGQVDSAVVTVEGLVSQLEGLTNTVALQFRPDAIALAGQIYEQKGDVQRALTLFERNLSPGVDPVRRREAAAQTSRLALERLKGEAAVERLETDLARYPDDPLMDPLRVALAELWLRRYFQLPAEQRAASLPLLRQVRQRIGPVLTNAPGPWVARAQFSLGWCGWEEATRGGGEPRYRESAEAFEGAVTGLPRSIEQVVARFKAGDARYALAEYATAVDHYWAAATNYGDFPQVRKGFGDHALYQIVRASIELGDLEAASRAMSLVLEWFPQSYFGDRSLLLFGQALGSKGKPAEARQLFTDFLQNFPSTSLAPELGLAVARTWQQEGDWAEASAEYERWMQAHADHPSRGQAAYELAWSSHRAGEEARAFEQFSRFLAEFPNHPLAPAALHWMADYHFRQGRFDLAESEYQRIYQNTNWPPSELNYHARLMAGRSAFRRTSYREARTYFTDLINKVGTNAPPGLLPEAYFALGDTIRQGADADKLVASLAEAIVAYNKIPQNHPTSPLVPLAWGEIGNCHFQLGKTDAKQYELALAAYTNVVESAANVSARSQAEVGMAMCLEAKAGLLASGDRAGLQVEALGHYLRVTEGANLREGEEADLFWVERAGTAGAYLAEQLQRWEVAERLYDRLMVRVPSSSVKYAARRDRVRQLRAESE